MSSYAVGKYDFCIPKGTDIIVPFRFRDSEGNLIDFGGFEARMQIRRFVNSSLVIDELTTYNARITVNVEEGTLTLHFPHALTEQYPTVNELKAAIGSVDLSALIDDTTPSADKTYSSSKIASEIAAKCQEVKNALLGGAGDAYDTLQELATLISTNKDAIDALTELAGSHVRYDQEQELSPEQKTQARTNIGAADDADYQKTKTAVGTVGSLATTEKTNLVGAVNEVLGVANTAKTTADTAKTTADTAKSTADTAKSTADSANTKAGQVESALNTFKGQIGATDTDFVAIYTAARDGTPAA